MLFFSELKEGENRPCAPLANVGQRVRSLTIAPGILDEFARVALISDSPSTFVVSKEHISLDHSNLFQLGTGEEEGRFDGEREREGRSSKPGNAATVISPTIESRWIGGGTNSSFADRFIALCSREFQSKSRFVISG